MIHTVPFSQLPANFRPPEALRDQFWYDSDLQQLCFDGFMSKAAYDQLKPLSQDSHYQRALDELFRISVPEEHDARRGKVSVIVSALVGLAVLSGLALFAMVR